MPSNNNMNINNNNNNNNEFNFIDETSKTREKCRKQRRMALKNIHKTKLRKQLQNNNNNNNKPIITKTHVVEEMMSINNSQQYNLPQLLVNHCHFTTTIKEEEQQQGNIDHVMPSTFHTERESPSNTNNNNSQLSLIIEPKRTMLISEEFGLKLDLEDFIQSLKDLL